MGFGFDLSEIDLWWLLNRKKRENASHETLHFYEPKSEKNEVKTALLEAYGAAIHNLGFKEPMNNKYLDFYNKAIEDIQKRVR